jgi:hypothetical protein
LIRGIIGVFGIVMGKDMGKDTGLLHSFNLTRRTSS